MERQPIVLVDAELSGLLIGATLATTPEEIYRALIEATAYGTRVIIETFEEHGVPIHEIVAAGGLAEKSPLNADLRRRHRPPVPGQRLGPDAGARLGDVRGRGGRARRRRVPDHRGRLRAMARAGDTVFEPIPANRAIYEQLYREYVRLHDYFGRGENDVMKRTLGMRAAARGERTAS